MKRRLPLSLLALTAGLRVMAGTLSGTVYYQSGPSNVGYMTAVHISDTLGTWNTTVYTDANGQYSVTIPASVATTAPGNQINVILNECGVWQRKIAINSGSPVLDFNVCTAGPAISGLQGVVYLGRTATTASSGSTKFYLVRKDYDPVMMDTVLTAVDSFTSSLASGGAFSQSYTSRPNGNLVLKAMFLPGHPNYAGYVPSYHGWGGLTPNQSWPLAIREFTGGTTNVQMVPGVNPGGPGFIGGHVSLGANKTAGVGDPLGGRALMLVSKTTPQVVAWTQSDAAGKFSFPSVPYGTYDIFGDQFGKVNPKLSITLSASSPRVGNILFEENDTKFSGKLENVSVPRTSPVNPLSLSPNPATDMVKVSGLAAITGSKTIVLRSMTGAEISRQSLLSGDAVIETATLPAGIYNVLVQTEQGNYSFRLTK